MIRGSGRTLYRQGTARRPRATNPYPPQPTWRRYLEQHAIRIQRTHRSPAPDHTRPGQSTDATPSWFAPRPPQSCCSFSARPRSSGPSFLAFAPVRTPAAPDPATGRPRPTRAGDRDKASRRSHRPPHRPHPCPMDLRQIEISQRAPLLQATRRQRRRPRPHSVPATPCTRDSRGASINPYGRRTVGTNWSYNRTATWSCTRPTVPSGGRAAQSGGPPPDCSTSKMATSS